MNGPASFGDDLGRAGGPVWLSAQRSPRAQRAGLLTAESVAHPARMLPDLAAEAIAAYSRPGEWVLDPMCGIGTTVVQAVRAGRPAVGIDLEPRWVAIARDNLDLARTHGPCSRAHMLTGDARRTSAILPEHLAGRISLVLTSPPYGAGVHGHLRDHDRRTPIRKINHRYSERADRADLARAGHGLTRAMDQILAQAAAVLRPGGYLVVVVRPWRHRGALIDLPSQVAACAENAGLLLVDRAVSLLARLDDDNDDSGGRLVPRASYFQRLNLRRARGAGLPIHLIAHEDVIIARRPGPPSGPVGPLDPPNGDHGNAEHSGQLTGSQPGGCEPGGGEPGGGGEPDGGERRCSP